MHMGIFFGLLLIRFITNFGAMYLFFHDKLIFREALDFGGILLIGTKIMADFVTTTRHNTVAATDAMWIIDRALPSASVEL